MIEALVASDLVKVYGDKQAVRSVSIEVRPAEVVGLLGPNGAGKTTTFNMIAGSVRPTRGRVFLGVREITELPMYRRARLGITRGSGGIARLAARPGHARRGLGPAGQRAACAYAPVGSTSRQSRP